ncbi:alpha/beta fold hydrolase [Plantibacter sp. CFBP 8798]|uniref:alpha/beta hydrolase family protein n=1 Tax=Plantibacter sp. CFBP 8798 TaxID=2775268 RepID=UPI00177D2CCC|nr:alpha/beta fold hydrolase [Plantibacter sp. CFBP 8798]MBD8465324.1 alpha/beta fold hydrolase [Plantibacter sp. CFBP 8798]
MTVTHEHDNTRTAIRAFTDQPRTTLSFVAVPSPSDDRAQFVEAESQAALRQFPVSRLTGYGIDISDALELHESVLRGERWQASATALAERCITRARPGEAVRPSTYSRISLLRRASALLRVSQVMLLTDSAERREMYRTAAALYTEAADAAGDRAGVSIETPLGTLKGWYIPAVGPTIGAALVIGGIEGYAMDFDSLGEALSKRGVTALLLDGPGQGASRFENDVYLSNDWARGLASAVDYLQDQVSDVPLAIIGNSMGGSFAMSVAAQDTRIVACCENGGVAAPWLIPPSVGTFYLKMLSFCGTTDEDLARTIWSTVRPLAAGSNTEYALLVVHGGADPLVSAEMADAMFTGAHVTDKRMVTFADGEHCIYNHLADRNALISDWVLQKVSTAKPATLPAREGTP